MLRNFISFIFLMMLSACASFSSPQYEQEEPVYNRLAEHINIIEKTSNFVVYEYYNIRVDEVAPIASLYCEDQGGKQATLYDINRRPDNRRRATFICK